MRGNSFHPRRFPPIVAALVTVLIVAAGPARAADDREERIEKTLELAGIQKVRVQNVNGPVRIESWENPTLSLVAVKKAKGSSAAETLAQTDVKIQKTATTIEIETVLPKDRSWSFFSWWGRASAEVSYELKLPPSVAVQVETVNGRIVAERRSGPLVLNTVNGSIRVSGQEGQVRANTVNGSVEVTFAGAARKSDLETVNGSVTVTAARDSSIRYNLQTVNGGIRSEFANLKVEGKWGPKEARGELNGGREPVTIETVNGEVRLQVAEAVPPR